MTCVLVGSLPAEASAKLANIGISFILIADPVDKTPPEVIARSSRMEIVPFKSDPFSILKKPIQEKISGVFSFTEFGLLPAALLSEALGISTVPVSAVLKTRNKFFMRCALKGEPGQLEFGIVDESRGQDIPYPIIVKPVDSSGSRGVQYIANAGEFLEFKQRWASEGSYLWEHYVDGPEFSVETVTWNGEHQVLGITEKITTGPPHFVEVGHFAPARLTPQAASTITETVLHSLDILGVSKGAAHTEVKYVHSQAYIIETHTRSGGDRITLLTELVSGLDQYEYAMYSILEAGKGAVARREKKFNYAGVRFFRWEQGTVSKIEGLDVCRNVPGLVEIELKINQGDCISPWKDSSDRPGHVVVGGNSPEEVEKRLTTIEDLIKVVYEG